MDIHNYILMGFNINEVFMRSFGHTQLYSNGIQLLMTFLCEVLDIHNYILMGFYINECFYEKFGHTQLYSNGIHY